MSLLSASSVNIFWFLLSSTTVKVYVFGFGMNKTRHVKMSPKAWTLSHLLDILIIKWPTITRGNNHTPPLSSGINEVLWIWLRRENAAFCSTKVRSASLFWCCPTSVEYINLIYVWLVSKNTQTCFGHLYYILHWCKRQTLSPPCVIHPTWKILYQEKVDRAVNQQHPDSLSQLTGTTCPFSAVAHWEMKTCFFGGLSHHFPSFCAG